MLHKTVVRCTMAGLGVLCLMAGTGGAGAGTETRLESYSEIVANLTDVGGGLYVPKELSLRQIGLDGVVLGTRLGEGVDDVVRVWGKPQALEAKAKGEHVEGLVCSLRYKGDVEFHYVNDSLRIVRLGGIEWAVLEGAVRIGDKKKDVLKALGRPARESARETLSIGVVEDLWFESVDGVQMRLRFARGMLLRVELGFREQ